MNVFCFIGWVLVCAIVIFVFGIIPLWYIGYENARKRKISDSKQSYDEIDEHY